MNALTIYAFITIRLDDYNALYSRLSRASLATARLQLVQNAAARLLTGIIKHEHITPVLASLHWLILKFFFLFLNVFAPQHLSDLFQLYAPSHSLRSADQLLLVAPKTKRKLRGDRAFSVTAPKLWNKLPLHHQTG